MWQPIETIPANERLVLICGKNNCDNWQRAIAFCTSGGVVEFMDDDNHYPDTFDEFSGESRLPEGIWIDAVCYSGSYDNMYVKPDFKPTHWQPLPKPPTRE